MLLLFQFKDFEQELIETFVFYKWVHNLSKQPSKKEFIVFGTSESSIRCLEESTSFHLDHN